MRRSRLLVISALLVGTTVYLVALYQSIMTFENQKEAELQEILEEWGSAGYWFVEEYRAHTKYCLSDQGQQMIFLGMLLCLVWLIVGLLSVK